MGEENRVALPRRVPHASGLRPRVRPTATPPEPKNSDPGAASWPWGVPGSARQEHNGSGPVQWPWPPADPSHRDALDPANSGAVEISGESSGPRAVESSNPSALGPANGGVLEPPSPGAVEPSDRGAAEPTRGAAVAAPVPASPAAPGPAARTQPSWAAVLATTMRLRAARRPHRPGRRWRLAGLIVLILAVGTAAGLVITRQGAMRAPGRQASGSRGARAAPGSAAVRGLAARWMARQVGGDVTLACDPVMCAALAAMGIPAANMVPVRPGEAGPPSADLVVATQAVRDHFGGRLAGIYAPLVIASFGTGRAQIQIRQVARDGVASFQRRLSSGRSVLRQASAELLRNSRIKLSAAARTALVAGRVDGRLLTVLAALAGRQPIRVLGFGDTNPGAAPGVP